MAVQPDLAAWLTPERATAWCRVLAACQAIWGIGLVLRAGWLPTDFTCFWAAASLTLRDGPAAAYDPAAMAAVEHGLYRFAAHLVEPFFYPPPFLMLCLPLGLLPPLAAAAAFITAGLATFVYTVRQLLPKTWSVLPILAFPGVMVTAGTGQNGFFTAACFAGGALLLEKRPFLAGLCLGALSCKPHLAVFVPIALLAARRWRALCGAGTAALGLAALSWLVLGRAAWAHFPRAIGAAGHMLAGGLANPGQLQSVFGAALILHAPPALLLAAQAWASLAALAVLVHVVSRRPGGRAEIAMLVVATLAASPYLMDYDLAALAIPLAWLAADAAPRGWRMREIGAGLAAYMMPLLTAGMATHAGLPLAPLLLAGFTAAIAGRALSGSPVSDPSMGELAPGWS